MKNADNGSQDGGPDDEIVAVEREIGAVGTEF